MTKAFKVEVLVIDCNNEDIKEEDIITEIEFAVEVGNSLVTVMGVTEKEIGEFHDNHPLNILSGQNEEYKKLFG